MFKHHDKSEKNSILLLIWTIIVISIGGIVEIVPLFRIETTIEKVEDRLKSLNAEVETGYSAQTAKEESKRCYLCYLHYEIDIDKCIYCRYCIDVAPRDCIKLVNEVKTNENGTIIGLDETSSWKDVNAIVIDNSRCIRCGECVRICPVDCISVTKVELEENVLKP